MADTSILDPFASKPKEQKASHIGGRVGFFDDLETAAENSGQFIQQTSKDFLGSTFELIKNEVVGKPFSRGSIENFQNQNPEVMEKLNQQKEADHQRMVFNTLEEARKNAQHFAHEQTLEDIARLEVAGMSPEEKNKSLHLNLDFDEKNINDPYHIHALRIKKMEEIREMARQKEDQEVATIMRHPDLLTRIDIKEGQSMVGTQIISAG